MRAFSESAVESAAASPSSGSAEGKKGIFGFFRSDDLADALPPSPQKSGDENTNKWGEFKNIFARGASSESEDPEPQVDDGEKWFPTLTYKERMMGFGACFIVGYVITFSSFSRFVHLLEGNPIPFVSVYTLGNLLSLGSMGFLCGPARQLRNMFHESRKLTSVTYISTLLLTLLLCFLPTPSGFAGSIKLLFLVLLLIVQLCASVWYSLSYIPFARRTASKFAKDHLGLGEFV